MTTIAWCGDEIAADTLITQNGHVEGRSIKIAKNGNLLAGASGLVSMCQQFLRWFENGQIGECPLHDMKDWDATGIIVAPDGVITRHMKGGFTKFTNEFYALGSGSEFAMGAMAAGLRPPMAVGVAARFDTGTGGDIMVLRRDPS